MATKLKPIAEVIANPPPPSRGKNREAERQKIEPQRPPRPPPREKR